MGSKTQTAIENLMNGVIIFNSTHACQFMFNRGRLKKSMRRVNDNKIRARNKVLKKCIVRQEIINGNKNDRSVNSDSNIVNKIMRR